MAALPFAITCILLSILPAYSTRETQNLELPIVINTWNFTSANARAWRELSTNGSALDAIEYGCGQCEIDRCDGTVGWGGSPAESGETTLDAMIMDGSSYDVGAVGGLRRVKNAIGVARMVLERTNHTLLVGDMATAFALHMGFKAESLSSNESRDIHNRWLRNSCQPNYWKNVAPDPRISCGPYDPVPMQPQDDLTAYRRVRYNTVLEGHDTVGMVAIDAMGKLAAGTSTNGLRHKILGRVGDSPVPGAGGYAAQETGAAAATGDGDLIMRFLLSYQAVENLRRGMSAQEAADDVIRRLMVRAGPPPYPQAAVIVLSKQGTYGSACSGFNAFPHVISDARRQVQTIVTECMMQ